MDSDESDWGFLVLLLVLGGMGVVLFALLGEVAESFVPGSVGILLTVILPLTAFTLLNLAPLALMGPTWARQAVGMHAVSLLMIAAAEVYLFRSVGLGIGISPGLCSALLELSLGCVLLRIREVHRRPEPEPNGYGITACLLGIIYHLVVAGQLAVQHWSDFGSFIARASYFGHHVAVCLWYSSLFLEDARLRVREA